MSTWWKNLKKGLTYEFGMLQVDCVGHSSWHGAQQAKIKTKESLKAFVEGICEALYDSEPIGWQGDGEPFLFLGRDGDVDPVVACALHLLRDLCFFNSLPLWNHLDFPITLRISAHIASILFNRDRETLQSDSLNFFLKHDRELGQADTVTITDSVYQRIASQKLRSYFIPVLDSGYRLRSGDLFAGALFRTRQGLYQRDYVLGLRASTIFLSENQNIAKACENAKNILASGSRELCFKFTYDLGNIVGGSLILVRDILHKLSNSIEATPTGRICVFVVGIDPLVVTAFFHGKPAPEIFDVAGLDNAMYHNIG